MYGDAMVSTWICKTDKGITNCEAEDKLHSQAHFLSIHFSVSQWKELIQLHKLFWTVSKEINI